MREIERTQNEVDSFYIDALKNLKKKIEKYEVIAGRLRAEEMGLKNKIKELERKIKEINDDPSNYVNKNKETNRLKNFNLEKKIFDYEKNIEKLKRELDWMRKMNDNEIKFIKEDCKKTLDEYDKLYKEKAQIDDAIIQGVLGKAASTDLGDIINAERLEEENDAIFKNNL